MPLRLIPAGETAWQALCGDCFRAVLKVEPSGDPYPGGPVSPAPGQAVALPPGEAHEQILRIRAALA